MHITSIVNEIIRTTSNQFFFLRKDFAHTKHKSKQKEPILSHVEAFMLENLLPMLFVVCLILFCWLVLVWFAFLYARNLFIKKNKLVWNCPNNLIYHTSFISMIFSRQVRIVSNLLVLSTDLLMKLGPLRRCKKLLDLFGFIF